MPRSLTSFPPVTDTAFHPWPASPRTSRSGARGSPASWRRSLDKHGVPVLAVQSGVEVARGWVRVQRPLQVLGHRCRALTVIGRVPAAVRLRSLDLAQAGRLHLAALDHAGGLVAVDPRPAAPRPAGRELLEEVGVVERLALTVDPAVRDRDVEHLRIRHARHPGGLLSKLRPYTGGRLVVFGEPLVPRVCGLEWQLRHFGSHGESLTRADGLAALSH